MLQKSRKSPKGCEIESGLRPPATEKLSMSTQQFTFFPNQGRIWQRKERNGLRVSSAVPKIQRASNSNCLYGY